MQLLFRGHPLPVAGPDIRAENNQSPLAHAVEEGTVRSKARKAEEWRCRRGPRLAVKSDLVGSDSTIDFGLRLGDRHVIEPRVGIAVVTHAMALREGAACELWVGRRISSQEEECCAHAFTFERIQDLRGGAGPGAVVKREDQLLGLQRQRRRKLLATNARR